MKRIIITITLTLIAALGALNHVQAAALVYTPPAQGLSNNFASTLGYEFTPSSPLLVYSLGFADLPSADVPSVGDGLEQPRFVGLWDSNGVLLASVTVPAGTAAPLIDRFRYQDLPTPITLAAGHTYILGAYFDRESDDHYTLNNGTLWEPGAPGRDRLFRTRPMIRVFLVPIFWRTSSGRRAVCIELPPAATSSVVASPGILVSPCPAKRRLM